MEHLELLSVALRVLNAVTYHHRSIPEDIAVLEHNARPDNPDLPIDDLACAIAMRELQRRRKRASEMVMA